MNLIQFTFANLFDFKLIMNAISDSLNPRLHSSNSDKLIIIFKYVIYTDYYIEFVNNICTPTNIKDLHE